MWLHPKGLTHPLQLLHVCLFTHSGLTPHYSKIKCENGRFHFRCQPKQRCHSSALMELREDLSNDKIVCWFSDEGDGRFLTIDFWQQIFGILIYFPDNGVHSEITAVVLLSWAAKVCCWWHVLRDMSQWHVPLTWPERTSPITWGRLTCGTASPHPWCASFPKGIIPPNKVVCCQRQGQDWLFWPTQAAKQRFSTSSCLLTCEAAGWLHQLWPAGWRSQSLLSSCVFRENHLRTQNLLTALGCCQTSVLNRGWRIHTGAQPCQKIRGRPSVFDSQLTETPVFLF